MAMGRKEMKFALEDLILKYCIGLSQRFTRKQKNIFINEIGKDFQECGYRVQGAASKKKGRYAVNLHIGDVGKSNILVVVNYDTPQHNFGNPMKYYPFDGPATFASSFLPIYAPFIIGGVLALWLVMSFVPNIDFSNNFVYSLFVSIALITVMVLSFIFTKGVANKVNFNRNTSSVIAALKLASELDDCDRERVAFVLTDNGCTNHAGDYMLREALPTTIDQRVVIMLDCIGDGEEFVIGYKEDSKQEATEIAEQFKIKPKRKLCKKEELRYTSFSFYKKAVLISKGNFKNNTFVVENISTNQDTKYDSESLNQVVEALKKYIKKAN